ncbi:DUF2975 domain-containing protein [Lacinutrix neustonica]|uniref:DUF2975 domain-containing protein n=1 Tax=Lacinutrix neustonica TaxID=2980107 RepID=A0A9E8MSW1_9FLAO|nr:DUF2975 domain-containing protein [Lacinutrix neustonica]WAC00847.1 DUF2975 domain-containing protein [Lacinutrix neustonica]
MKLKMFGKRSLSTLLFYVVLLCLLFVVFIFFQFIPDLLFKDDIPVLLNILPMLGYLGFLIPLGLLLNTFRKEKIFTSKAVKYLNIFAVLNLVIPAFNVLVSILIYDFEFMEVAPGLPLHIMLVIFSLFLASVFKQGFQIQQENELTI